MNWDLILLLTGLMLFAYWLNYLMGGPLSDEVKHVDPKAILFAFPLYLATRRLKINNLWQDIWASQLKERALATDPKTRIGLRKDQRLEMYLAGRDFFTWERAILCPICFHWWLSLIVAAVLLSGNWLGARSDFFLAAFTYLVNHLLIRKIS